MSAAAVVAAPLTRRRAPRPLTVLGVASIGVFMAFVDATIVNIAFPDMARSFSGTDISALSWILNAYNIVFAAFLVAAGRLADLLGRRRIFLVGLMTFTVASGLCAIAPSVGTLVAARIVQALGAALMVPSSLGLVLEAFPADQRTHAVALQTAVAAVAAGVGPSLGGLLVALSDWRLVFLVNVPIGVAAYVLSRRHLVESRSPGRRRVPDLLGTVVFALAVAVFVLAVVQGEEWGWGDVKVLGAFAIAVLLGAWFVQRCRTVRSPVVDLALLRVRTFSVANGMTLLAAAGFYGYTLVNVLFLTGVWRYSVLEAGLAITPGPFVAAAVAGPASRLAERIGHRIACSVGALLWGAAVLWLVTQVGTTPAYASEWLPGIVLLGLGAGIAFPNVSGAAVAAAPGRSFATATALNSVARQIGGALGVAVVVALIGTPTTIAGAADAFDAAWTFAAVCMLAAGVGCLFMGRIGVEDDTSLSPSLGEAARVVLRAEVAEHRLAAAAPAAAPVRSPAALREAPTRPESTADFLGQVPILAGLDVAQREALAARTQPVRVRAGDWLFHEGDPGDALYVVRAGRLEVMAERPDGGGRIAELGRGAVVGEIALLTGGTRTASVRAARDADLIRVPRADFDRLLVEQPSLSLALTRTLGERLAASRMAAPEPQPRSVPVAIAVTALDPAAPVTALARDLATALARDARVVVLDGTEAPPPDRVEDAVAAYAPVLDRAEHGADHVVLLTDSPFGDDAWTAFCLQQADRVLAVATGAATSVPDAAPTRADLARCDLVGIDVAVGSGALAGWAEALRPLESHVVRSDADYDGDVARMARRLSGRSIGIVLSGGGARAFSHIGVLEELMAAGVTIDRVAGVSMGAFVGALFAGGRSADEMDAIAYEEFVRARPLGDYTVPRHALIRGERVRALLNRTFGDSRIEELERSLFVASADLKSAELVVVRSGLVGDAVGHSMALPVIGPPQLRDGRFVVDGSLVDNLPVATMAEMGEGPIIAVDVKASFKASAAANGNGNGASTNGNGHHHHEDGPRVPGLPETLTRVLLLASADTSAAARRHADLTITPRNDGVGLLEFHQLDAAREAGRVAAREALDRAPAWVA